jgi:hypothetical protein
MSQSISGHSGLARSLDEDRRALVPRRFQKNRLVLVVAAQSRRTVPAQRLWPSLAAPIPPRSTASATCRTVAGTPRRVPTPRPAFVSVVDPGTLHRQRTTMNCGAWVQGGLRLLRCATGASGDTKRTKLQAGHAVHLPSCILTIIAAETRTNPRAARPEARGAKP